MLREFALISFTILAQMSVGAFLVLGLVRFFVARKAGQEEADRMCDRSLVAVVIILGLGMVASLFHLAHPLSAPRAITNFATSWLSREILSGSVFFALSGVYMVLQLFKLGPAVLRTVVAWLAALVGVVFVYNMSMIYMLPTQPAWDSLATPVSFFTTALLLGLLSMGAAFVANYSYVKRKDPSCADVQCQLLRSTLRSIAVASVILLGVELVVIPVYLVSLASGSPQAIASARLISGQYGLVFLLRVVLAFAGAGVFGFFLYQNTQKDGNDPVLGFNAYTAFALVFVAEVLGRFIFYATQIGISL